MAEAEAASAQAEAQSMSNWGLNRASINNELRK